MTTILSVKDQIIQLEEVIKIMQAKGSPTDFLQDRLLQLKNKSVKPSNGIDLFELEKPLDKYVFINDEELLQLQTFGYCINEDTDLDVLRATPQYKFQVNNGENLGF